ncbi:hypothetical protein Tco_0622957 [Tanacetum coccineum]
MFEDNSYKAHEAHNDLYEALQKSLELDYSNQRLADQEEARKKKRKKRTTLRTPSGSPPSPPPPLPPPAGTSGAIGTSGASRSSQLPPPPPLPSTGALGSDQLQGSKAPSSSEPAASTHQSMAWTTSDTRFESTGFTAALELSLTNYLMQDDSIPEEQVHLFDDEDSENDHQLKADSRKDWWKPLPEGERPATPKPAWTIPSSNKSDVVNKWASALATTYEPPAENSLLTNPEGDNGRIDVNRPLPLGGPPGHVTIQPQFFFNIDLEYLRYGSKGNNPALSISKMKAASYPDFGLELLVSEQMWIDDVRTYDISAKYGISHWWFNRQKFYIDRHDSPSRRKDVRTHMRILSVVRIKAYSRYGYDYLSKIVLRRAGFQEHKIAEKDFKNLYPSDFEDLNLLFCKRVKDFQLGIESYQTQLNLTKPGWDATCYEFKHDYTIMESPRVVVFSVNNNERKIMRFNKIYKFSDGTLTRILEALDYRVKEFKVKWLNPVRTEMELVLEHTQQGTSNEVSVNTEGVEELKRNVKIKGEKKAALL